LRSRLPAICLLSSCNCTTHTPACAFLQKHVCRPTRGCWSYAVRCRPHLLRSSAAHAPDGAACTCARRPAHAQQTIAAEVTSRRVPYTSTRCPVFTTPQMTAITCRQGHRLTKLQLNTGSGASCPTALGQHHTAQSTIHELVCHSCHQALRSRRQTAHASGCRPRLLASKDSPARRPCPGRTLSAAPPSLQSAYAVPHGPHRVRVPRLALSLRLHVRCTLLLQRRNARL
jgi:hypothetical protein